MQICECYENYEGMRYLPYSFSLNLVSFSSSYFMSSFSSTSSLSSSCASSLCFMGESDIINLSSFGLVLFTLLSSSRSNTFNSSKRSSSCEHISLIKSFLFDYVELLLVRELAYQSFNFFFFFFFLFQILKHFFYLL